jgi:hypothetical protein
MVPSSNSDRRESREGRCLNSTISSLLGSVELQSTVSTHNNPTTESESSLERQSNDRVPRASPPSPASRNCRCGLSICRSNARIRHLHRAIIHQTDYPSALPLHRAHVRRSGRRQPRMLDVRR